MRAIVGRRVGGVLLTVWAALQLGGSGCAAPEVREVEERPALQSSTRRVYKEVRGAVERWLNQQQTAVLDELRRATDFPADHQRPAVIEALIDPWAGTVALEDVGLRLLEQAQLPTADPVAVLNILTMVGGQTITPVPPPPAPAGDTLEQQVIGILHVLEQAKRERDRALAGLSQIDRRFLFVHAEVLAREFFPQVDRRDDSRQMAEAHERFARLATERVSQGALVAAAKVLLRLAEAGGLNALERTTRGLRAIPIQPPGITGDLLVYRATPFGAVIIGGPGANTYTLDSPVAVLMDIGGNDTYRGMLAATGDPEPGLSVLIDLSGDDTYEGAALGLATGRLGVGLLVDRQGNDEYRLAPGSGGAGLAGVGVLLDRAGRDRYVGSRFTQGVAVGGLGLLLDENGDDLYESAGFAIGFGGPGGVGTVLDVRGSDHYQCGGIHPSVYNASEAPEAPAGDARFQYDCFGLGTGSGLRVASTESDRRFSGLAGGVGLLVDGQGDDDYRGSNFSQGSGYFFGAGVLLDVAGDDVYDAARYGLAGGAHYAVGLLVDGGGQDRYASSGPVYSAGAAWDRSVMVLVDAGPEGDVYDLGRSTGLGIADYHGWAVFVDEGGDDRYIVPEGLGAAARESLSVFCDLAGNDDYANVPRRAGDRRENGRTGTESGGGLFLDR